MPSAEDYARENALLRAEFARRDAELSGLTLLRRMQFGRSSEKLAAEIGQLELLLEDLEEGEATRVAATPAPASASVSGRRQPVRRLLPEHLPREEVVHHPGDRCPCCGGTRLSKLGEDVTEVLERVPARLKVIRHVRPRLSCRACETILQAPAPDLPIEKGRPGPALIANVFVGKYIDGVAALPPGGDHRARRRRRRPRDVVRLGRAHRLVAGPDRRADRSSCARRANDPHRRHPDRRARARQQAHQTGRIWTYVVDERPWAGARPSAALYRYSPDRKGERPAAHLTGYKGVIHADAYAGYEALTRATAPPGIAHAACWAHARRKLYDVHEATASPVAAEGLRRIGELYEIEREIVGMPPERRLAIRQARTAPLLAGLRDWMEAERRRLSSKTALAKALQDALTRWDALARFTTDGRIGIDNNPAERALRGIAVTRKNFLFLGSDAGGERAAIIYSALETARLNGVDPERWLADVIDRLARRHSQPDLDQLLPWNCNQPEPIALAA